MSIGHMLKQKNRHTLLALLVLAYICALVSVVHAQQGLQTETKKHFLWSIETKKNTMYILGSMHLLRSDSYPLPKEIEAAYGKCQKVVFEADLDGMKDPALQTKMMTLGLYLDDQTLEQNLSEKTYKLLKERIIGAGLSIAQFQRFRPWFCALTLTVIELQRLGFDPSYGIDTYFFNKAKNDAKEKLFLEPVEYQLDLFAKMNEQEQDSLLRQTLQDLEVIEIMATDMVNAWKAGDVDKLDAMMNISFKEHPGMHDRLIVQRNKKWIPHIENLMNQNDNVLVIVGAGHLVGAKSLLDLLRTKGYKIEQR